jgi:intraflagellar transport protein 80
LCSLCLAANKIEIACTCYVNLKRVAHVEYLRTLLNKTGEERAAGLSVFRGQFSEGEQILLNCGKVFEAIKMCCDVFRFERALEISLKFKTHVDSVLYLRKKYLEYANRIETNKDFIECGKEVIIYSCIRCCTDYR